jgi:hypothetical protein
VNWCLLLHTMGSLNLALGRPPLARRHRAHSLSHEMIRCRLSRQVRPNTELAEQPSPVCLLCSTRGAVYRDLTLILHTSHKRLRLIFQSPLTLMLLPTATLSHGPRVYALPALPKILNHFSQCWANTSVASS